MVMVYPPGRIGRGRGSGFAVLFIGSHSKAVSIYLFFTLLFNNGLNLFKTKIVLPCKNIHSLTKQLFSYIITAWVAWQQNILPRADPKERFYDKKGRADNRCRAGRNFYCAGNAEKGKQKKYSYCRKRTARRKTPLPQGKDTSMYELQALLSYYNGFFRRGRFFRRKTLAFP